MAFEKDPDELGALWLKSGAKGDYMTGEINGVKVVCFKPLKGGEKAPTWRVMKSKPREEMAHGVAPVSQLTDQDVPF